MAFNQANRIEYPIVESTTMLRSGTIVEPTKEAQIAFAQRLGFFVDIIDDKHIATRHDVPSTYRLGIQFDKDMEVAGYAWVRVRES